MASDYGNRGTYISGSTKVRLAVSAVLIHDDEIIAWASDNDLNFSELQKAATRWFVCNSGSSIKKAEGQSSFTLSARQILRKSGRSQRPKNQ